MKRYRLRISYDGEAYVGWQVQPNGHSVQEIIHRALKKLNLPVTLHAQGRTDAGVHALAQIAHFDFEGDIDSADTLSKLNEDLPIDIRVLALEQCPLEFHARFSALRKIYHYTLHTESFTHPFNHKYRHHFRYHFDLELLKNAAQKLVGQHDFKALANNNDEGSASKDSIRTLYRVDVEPVDGGLRIEFEGSGFLYKMVRNCTGLLLEVARGHRPIEDIELILNQDKRQEAGSCAPAHGLCLYDVLYPKELQSSSVIHFL